MATVPGNTTGPLSVVAGERGRNLASVFSPAVGGSADEMNRAWQSLAPELHLGILRCLSGRVLPHGTGVDRR
jgi:hypothetical protein